MSSTFHPQRWRSLQYSTAFFAGVVAIVLSVYGALSVSAQDGVPSGVEAADESPDAPVKLPVPGKTVRQEKRKEILAIFQFDDARTPQKKLELMGQVLAAARETKEDSAAQFEMLNLVREQAVALGQIKLAFQAIDELDRAFDVSASDLRLASLEQAGKSSSAETKKEVIEYSVEMVDALMKQDRFDQAVPLSASAVALARGLRDAKLIREVGEQRKSLEALAQKFDRAKNAFAKLKSEPDNADANLSAGRYLTFVKLDWTKGLEHLAKGNDPSLVAAAKADLHFAATAAEQERVGEAWWVAGEAQKDADAKALCRARSAYWYRQAVEGLAGLAKAKAQRRIKDAGDVAITAGAKRPTSVASKPETSDTPVTGTTNKKKRTAGGARTVIAAASGNNGNIIYVNGIEVARCSRDKATVFPLVLRPGDVITVKVNDRFDIMSHWMMIATEKGEPLFETSDRWLGYLPANQERWWDVSRKDIKSAPAEYAKDEREYVGHVKLAASKALPDKKLGQPIYSSLMNGDERGTTFLGYVVTADDLGSK
jgi:hypothetical protein